MCHQELLGALLHSEHTFSYDHYKQCLNIQRRKSGLIDSFLRQNFFFIGLPHFSAKTKLPKGFLSDARLTLKWIQFLFRFLIYFIIFKNIFFPKKKKWIIQNVSGIYIKKLSWLFLSHFWPLLQWVVFFKTVGVVVKIGSSLKPNHHNQAKLVQSLIRTVSDKNWILTSTQHSILCNRWVFNNDRKINTKLKVSPIKLFTRTHAFSAIPCIFKLVRDLNPPRCSTKDLPRPSLDP